MTKVRVHIRIRNPEWIIQARAEAVDVHLTIAAFLYGAYLLTHPTLFVSNPAYVFLAEYGVEWQWGATALLIALSSSLRILWPTPPSAFFVVLTKFMHVAFWAVVTAAFYNLPIAPASTVLYFANTISAAWSLKRG